MNVDLLAPLLALQAFLTGSASDFLRQLPTELLKWFLLPLIAAAIASVYFFLRRRARRAVLAVARIVDSKNVGVTIEVHRFAHDTDREFEGSLFTKLSAMFYSWNDADHPDVVSVLRSEAAVGVTDISKARAYVDRRGRTSGNADVEVFGWHARSGATGGVIVLDRSGGAESGKLEMFSLGEPKSEELFEARIYEAVSRSVAMKHEASDGSKWSLAALRAALASARDLRGAALLAGQARVAEEANVLRMAIRDDIAERSSEASEMREIAVEMSGELGDWSGYHGKASELSRYSRLLFKLSFLDSDTRALDASRRSLHRAIGHTASSFGAPRALYLPYLIVCAALSPITGDRKDLKPINPGSQFTDDVEIAAWVVCSRSGIPDMFLSRPGLYPLVSIKAAIECLPHWAASVFVEQLGIAYLAQIRRTGDLELLKVLSRTCQLLPTGGDAIASALNRATRCMMFGALGQHARIAHQSPGELREQSDMELRRLTDVISLDDLDLRTLHGFLVFDHVFNPLVLSESISSGRKLSALQRVDEFVSSCSIFMGVAQNSLSTLVSALNNAATKTGDIVFAKRALSILDAKRINPSFHTTYLRAYALVECVELADDGERHQFVKEAKKEMLRLRTATSTNPSESSRRTVVALAEKLETALALPR